MKKFLSLSLSMTLLLGTLWFGVPASASGEITNGVFNYVASGATTVTPMTIGADRLITPGFTAPVYKADGITDPAVGGYYSTVNMTSWFKLFGDSNDYQHNYVYSVPEQLKTATYIRLNRGWRGDRLDTTNNLNAIGSENKGVLTFDVNKPADIYYIFPNSYASNIATYAPWLNHEGWTNEGTVQVVESNGSKDSGNLPLLNNYVLLKKTVVVPTGSTQNVKIGGYQGSYFVPMVYVDFVEDTGTLATISNGVVRKYNATTQAIETQLLGSANIVTTGFTAPIYKDSGLTPSDFGYYDTTNMTSWFSVFSDTNYLKNIYFYDLPEEMKQAQYIRLSRSIREPMDSSKNPNAMNAQSEVLTFDVNHTAHVYYVLPGIWESNTANASWLAEDGWDLIEERAQLVESNANPSQNPQIKNYLVFRKKFITPFGTNEKVRIGGYLNNFFSPMVFVDWVDEAANKNVEVIVTGNGRSTRVGHQTVLPGNTFSFKAIPDEGHAIEHIKFNGQIVYSYFNKHITYTTPAILEDAQIEVKFIEEKTTPELVTLPVVFTEPHEETLLPSGITFATALEFPGVTLKNFGIVFSKDNPTPTIENGGKTYEGMVPRNYYGQYGIQLYGEALIPNATYYTTPYAIYVNDAEEEIIVYGESTEFIPKGIE